MSLQRTPGGGERQVDAVSPRIWGALPCTPHGEDRFPRETRESWASGFSCSGSRVRRANSPTDRRAPPTGQSETPSRLMRVANHLRPSQEQAQRTQRPVETKTAPGTSVFVRLLYLPQFRGRCHACRESPLEFILCADIGIEPNLPFCHNSRGLQ